MSNNFSVTFWSGVGTATGSNFMLNANGTRVLIDCGMLQGVPHAHAFNRSEFPYDPKDVDYLVVTHAHIDHIGRIPKLVKDGFRGTIYSTPETKAISVVMFDDMVKLLDFSAREEGILPMYDAADVRQTLSRWQEMPYHTDTAITDRLHVYFKDAGHILGSAICEFSFGGKKIAFTGDLGNSPTPLLEDTEPVTNADYLVMESVYGDRNHESQETRRALLKQAILDAIVRKSILVIPAFSLERTQVLLYEINNLVEEDGVPAIPVFLDSPLAIKITHIYKALKKDFKKEVREEIAGGDDIFNFPKLRFSVSSDDSKDITNVPAPKIIIAGSGMSEGGRVIHHEKHYLPDPKNILLLTGYQSVGTLGRQLAEGAKKIVIGGEEVPVRAEIRSITGYSSHKDSDGLIEYAAKAAESGKLKKVFVVLGEPKSSLFLTQRINDYVGVAAIVPVLGKTYAL